MKIEMAAAMDRLGTESAFEVLGRAKALEQQGKHIINLGIGQPDFPTPEHIVEAAVKALRDGHHGYTPADGIPALKQAVAADIAARRHVTIDPANVLIVPGGKVTMFFAITMFGQPGAEIIYPNPGFPIYQSMINYSGAKAVAMPLHEKTGFSFNADEVLGLITSKTRLLIINSPGNPTGGVVGRAEMEKLVAGLESHPQVCILSDEIYSRMLYEDNEHVSLLEFPSIRDRVILLDGWSKTYAMTGWRLGYGVWPETLIEPATRLAINCHSCVNAPSQYAGIAALEGPQDAVEAMVRSFDERRRVITDELNQTKGIRSGVAGGAFYAFANITGTGLKAIEFQDRMLNEAGVATIAGSSFGEMGEGFVRFTYANSRDNIKAAIGQIREIL
ncbi:MAG: pyridoxal phosphate-dependent aminotransferase [Rhodospirillales bacterium]